MDNHKKSFIINTLRRGTYRWPGRWLAEKRSKLSERGSYYCENPECGLVCRKSETQMDHIIPVVLTSGWDGLENVADRMYCSPEGFQRLCRECHAIKTKTENQTRPRPPKKSKNKK